MNKPECKTYPNGDKVWWLNDKRHREDGPAVERANGTKVWYLNDELHHEDGPAVEFADGDKEWWLNGMLHREDGPACELTNGGKEWYLNGEEVNPETIADLWLAKNIYCIYNPETDCLEFE